MNSSNLKKRENWSQALWWLGLYVFWIMVFQQREFSFSRTATIEFCYLLFIAANFYLTILYFVPAFLYKRNYVSFAMMMLASIAVAALLRVPLAIFLNERYFLTHQPLPGFRTLFINSFLNIFIWVVCLVAGKLVIDRFRFQRYIDETTKQKEQAELDFLNAQFNPHFLFNSLNSIYGHIDKNNTTARTMLLTFSEMLRYQLYDCDSNAIVVEKEMDYIRNYVALQKARREEGLRVDLLIANGVRGFSIAPLLFIAFIENSFKYVGFSEENENRVAISFTREADTLCFNCHNTREGNFNNPIEHKGIGIANVQRRLKLLYPETHQLVIVDNPSCYEVNLKLKIN